jgi:hypothetical protein
VIIEVVDQSGYRDSVIPVDDVDAGLTNSAVESLRLTRSHLYLTLQYIYPEGRGIAATARLMARAESTIKAQLEEADRALAAWFTARQEKQQAAKINFELVRKNSFTT